MIRSYTAAALAGVVLVTGFAVAQPLPKPVENSNVMLLTKEGKPPRRCKVIRTWKHPSGGIAYEVKAEDNGEIMTVVESNPAAATTAVTKPVATPPTAAKPVSATQTTAKPVVAPKTAAKPVAAPMTAAKPVAATKTVSKPVVAPKVVAKAEKPVVVPQVVAKAEKPVMARGDDPILTPTKFSGDQKVQKLMPGETAKAPTPAVQYTKKPVPAKQRWFAFFETSEKPAPMGKTAVVAKPIMTPPVPVAIEARYHPDPVVRLVGALKDDDLPSLREVAAESLARMAQGRPDVVEVMIQSAQTDPAPSVRACCCRCLAGMQVKTPECRAALHTLQVDDAPVVREEAAAALARLMK